MKKTLFLVVGFNIIISYLYTIIRIENFAISLALFTLQVMLWGTVGYSLGTLNENVSNIVNIAFIINLPGFFLLFIDSVKIAIVGSCDNLSRFWLGPTETMFQGLPIGNTYIPIATMLFPVIIIMSAVITKRDMLKSNK